MNWKKLGSRQVYKNPWIRVREDIVKNPAGRKGIYGVVEIPPGVFVIALNKKNEALLVKQHRYCTGMTSWEIPGGGLKRGKSMVAQAREELREEAHAAFRSMQKLGTTQTQPGVITQLDHFFVARGTRLVKGSNVSMRTEGIAAAKFFSLSKILHMINSRAITHGQTLTAFMLFFSQAKKVTG